VYQAFLEADSKLMGMTKKVKKQILKSRPYFNCKVKHDQILMGAYLWPKLTCY